MAQLRILNMTTRVTYKLKMSHSVTGDVAVDFTSAIVLRKTPQETRWSHTMTSNVLDICRV